MVRAGVGVDRARVGWGGGRGRGAIEADGLARATAGFGGGCWNGAGRLRLRVVLFPGAGLSHHVHIREVGVSRLGGGSCGSSSGLFRRWVGELRGGACRFWRGALFCIALGLGL